MINNELYHYGVKGMKWGVRRKSNKDSIISKAEKMSDKHTHYADKTLKKQEKLQNKRINKYNTLRDKGKVTETSKYTQTTDKEKKLLDKHVKHVNASVGFREYAYSLSVDNMSPVTIRRGRKVLKKLEKHYMQ